MNFDLLQNVTPGLDTFNNNYFDFYSDEHNENFTNYDHNFYHYSIPNVKLFYPEPFIASPTFAHDDLWFLHIVIYQYWLWFFFIFIIIFFFITFLVTVRWCNIRLKPMRETRGVSRSKCGDLITATVPVSWAASIIIHESTDAIEIADGFGTTEMAVGIRAYQWGWEYYYPKDLDLNFWNKNNAYFLGSSLKYQLSDNRTAKNQYFKSDLLKNDVSQSTNVLSLLLKSLKLSSVNYSNYILSFGSNKLISTYTTNLITTNKLFSLNSLLSNWSLNKDSQIFNSKLNHFKKYYFFDTVTPKPVFVSNHYNFINTFFLFNSSLNYLNRNLLPQFISNDFKIDLFDKTKQNFNFLFLKTNAIKSLSSMYSSVNDSKVLTSPSKVSTELGNSFKNKNVMNIFSYLEYNTSSNNIVTLVANQDFKRWDSSELLEDFHHNYSFNSDHYSFYASVNKNFYAEKVLNSENLYFNYLKQNKVIMNDLSLKDTTSLPALKLTSFSPLSVLTHNTHSLISSIYWSEEVVTDSWLSFINLLNHNTLFKLNTFIFFKFNFKALSVFELLELYNNNNAQYINNNNVALSPLSTNNNVFQTNDSVSDYVSFSKNLMVFAQAFKKVFKTTIEEERSASSFFNITQSAQPIIFISEESFSLFNNFHKNSNFFVQPLVYKKNHSWGNYPLASLEKLTEYFSNNFPFSLSFESDIIRYSWFDWYSLRNKAAVKALDTSLFGLHGAKYYTFNFTNNSMLSNANQLDNYFNKYKQNRGLFIPSSVHTPALYNQLITSNLNLSLCEISKNVSGTLVLLQVLDFFNVGFFNVNKNLINKLSSNFSGFNAPMQNQYNVFNSQSSSINFLSVLIDILTKREFLYKKFLNYTTHRLVKSDYIVSYNSDLVADFKNIDVISKTNTNYVLSNVDKKAPADLTLKSQYQTMRKGVTNMIRIQADKAIAMPIETRLQVLAVSKDIIHSWSIPSAGIKIDCIPGYSSHRVLIFLVSGIYWGQCMEICGRFHHWMPIVVYFMKRDLFCLWCIHFIFKNNNNNNLIQSYIGQTYNASFNLNYSLNSWFYNI